MREIVEVNKDPKYDIVFDNILNSMLDKMDIMLKNLHQESKRRIAYHANSYTTMNPAGSMQSVSFIWLDVKKSKLPLLTISRTFDGQKKPDLYINRNTKRIGPHRVLCSYEICLDDLVTIEKAIFSALEDEASAIRQLMDNVLKQENKGAL